MEVKCSVPGPGHIYPCGKSPRGPTKQKAKWASDLFRTFRRRQKCLSTAENQTTAPRFYSPSPGYIINIRVKCDIRLTPILLTWRIW